MPTGADVVLLDFLLDYHVVALNALAASNPRPVVALCLSERDRVWRGHTSVTPQFDVHVLFPGVREAHGQMEVASAVVRWLDRLKPNALLLGYSTLWRLRVLAWARKHRVGTVLTSDTTISDRRRLLPLELFKSWLVKHYQTALVAGPQQREYLAQLGFPPARVSEGLYIVDVERFAHDTKLIRSAELEWRGRLGLHGPFFLYVGRLVPPKNTRMLVSAYNEYARTVSEPWPLVLVGDGPERPALESIARLGNVVFTGHKETPDLIPYYALARVLLLPSTSEPWGQVVPEAMACGCPAVVSDRCGCGPPLLGQGDAGIILPHDDPARWTQTMVDISGGSVDLGGLASQAVTTVQGYGPARYATGARWCIDTARAILEARSDSHRI